eukprot:1142195-Pelagomonas_calceolata.AAC.2
MEEMQLQLIWHLKTNECNHHSTHDGNGMHGAHIFMLFPTYDGYFYQKSQPAEEYTPLCKLLFTSPDSPVSELAVIIDCIQPTSVQCGELTLAFKLYSKPDKALECNAPGSRCN